jgi:hypothetical protein
MSKGSVGLEYIWWGFALASWPFLTLYFRAPGRKRLAILGTSNSKAAFRCDSCGTIVVPGEVEADTPVSRATLRFQRELPLAPSADGVTNHLFEPPIRNERSAYALQLER